MVSPARAHFLRESAARLAEKQGAAGGLRPDLTAYEQMLAQLNDHKRRLHEIQSKERKIELKRTLLPDYAAWNYGVMQGDSGLQDEVFITTLVWQFDVGDWAQALQMASYAIRHKLVMPDTYKRTLATVVAEEIATAALTPDSAVPVDVLVEASNITATEDMPDQVRAKLYKAIGYGLRKSSAPASALEYLNRALALYDGVGVKKDIEILNRELKKAGTTGEQDTAAPAA